MICSKLFPNDLQNYFSHYNFDKYVFLSSHIHIGYLFSLVMKNVLWKCHNRTPINRTLKIRNKAVLDALSTTSSGNLLEEL